jgi:histidinol-phosphate aminotransferase
MSVSPRDAVAMLKPAHHGGLDYAALRAKGISPEEVLDFSVNVNPFGPPLAVQEAVAAAAIARYPDTRAGALRERLAAINGVKPEQVLVTNGLSQAIWLLALAYIRPGDLALVLAPTFGEYRVACELMRARVESWCSRAKDGFRPDIAAIASWVRNHHPRLTWLCNPNNPTGLYLTEKEMHLLLEACIEAGSLLVVDEAYINFVESAWASVALLKSGHLVLLRSMTKDYALAGLRLGYLLASAEVIEVLSKAQPPWSVNAVAQETGLAALESHGYYRDTWRKLRRLTLTLRCSLLDLGLEVLPTDANFMLVHVGDAVRAQEELWEDRILARDCVSFGLPAYIRVGTRLEEDNRRLVSCLKRFLEGAFLWAN